MKEELTTKTRRHKVITLFFLSLCLSVFVVAYTSSLLAQSASPSQPDYVVVLDQNGTRGLVFFDHKGHQGYVNPDPDYKFKADKNATCAGCHHTKSATGVIQLWSCRACHGYETKNASATPAAPMRSKIYADDAFHGNCISCHRAQKKGPVVCSGCHKLVPRQ